ncbi:hypothetical protein ACTHAM_001130 [Cellulomonas soli]|uniref:hypothetical protein n=1 Tax=Cellulomonas soli TaxID=931535 RepID=UPI003F86FC21
MDDLRPFLTAAQELDTRVRATAPLVSASVHDTEVLVEQSTAEAVRALDVDAVAATIPDGVSDDLLAPVLVVYSELVSRVRAMSGFGYAGTYARDAESSDGEQMVACLTNGSEAARRFAGDLAAVRAAAEAAPPVADVDPTSTTAATLAVRIEDIDLRNSGCGGCGGYLVDGLAPVTWADGSTTTRTGSVGTQGEPDGIAFTATYDPVDGWTVVLNAC